jgi:hypothetical protein
LKDIDDPVLRPIDWILRFIVPINLALDALSWSKVFAGTENRVGIADQLFGWFRIIGFRIDVVFLVVCFFGCLLATSWLWDEAKTRAPARLTLFLCILDVLGFLIYAHHLLFSGLLWFG